MGERFSFLFFPFLLFLPSPTVLFFSSFPSFLPSFILSLSFLFFLLQLLLRLHHFLIASVLTETVSLMDIQITFQPLVLLALEWFWIHMVRTGLLMRGTNTRLPPLKCFIKISLSQDVSLSQQSTGNPSRLLHAPLGTSGPLSVTVTTPPAHSGSRSQEAAGSGWPPPWEHPLPTC